MGLGFRNVGGMYDFFRVECVVVVFSFRVLGVLVIVGKVTVE